MQNRRNIYVHRTLEHFFQKAAGQFPVMLLVGARQVGKTTFLKKISEKNRAYVTLDDPLILSLAKSDAALFFQRFSPPLIIDEIQYAPELLPYIKMAVDKSGGKNLFWLTGSQQFHLMKGITESLAGRVGIVNLLGFSHRESLRKGKNISPFWPSKKVVDSKNAGFDLSLKELYRIIFRGAFPAIALSDEMDRNLFYSSYVQTYLQRDVTDLINVGDKVTFLRFLKAAAARTGQLLNISELAKDADISPNTAKKWLSVLETSNIVFLLYPFSTNINKRLVKAPKLYFLDTGLSAWLTEWSSPETLEAGAFSGAVFETWVFSEILKTWLNNGLQPSFYYYRDKDQKEIDLLIILDGTIYPVEIKKTASPNKEMVRHFKTLERFKMPIGDGGLICLVREPTPLTQTISAIPARLI